MTRNHEDYPDPEVFRPERFIGADGQIDPTVRDPGSVVFGFGRRYVVSIRRRYSSELIKRFSS